MRKILQTGFTLGKTYLFKHNGKVIHGPSMHVKLFDQVEPILLLDKWGKVNDYNEKLNMIGMKKLPCGYEIYEFNEDLKDP